MKATVWNWHRFLHIHSHWLPFCGTLKRIPLWVWTLRSMRWNTHRNQMRYNLDKWSLSTASNPLRNAFSCHRLCPKTQSCWWRMPPLWLPKTILIGRQGSTPRSICRYISAWSTTQPGTPFCHAGPSCFWLHQSRCPRARLCSWLEVWGCRFLVFGPRPSAPWNFELPRTDFSMLSAKKKELSASCAFRNKISQLSIAPLFACVSPKLQLV